MTLRKVVSSDESLTRARLRKQFLQALSDHDPEGFFV